MNSSITGAKASVYKIEGPQTIAKIERELSEIASRHPEYMQIPVHPSAWWFGGEAALIQLLITWGRRQPNATLVTHIDKAEDPQIQLDRLVNRPFGLSAVWMARDLMDRSQHHPLKVQANKASDPVIDQMWFGRQPLARRQPSLLEGTEFENRPEVAPVGASVFLACIDHHPQWRLPHFYFSTGEFRHTDDFVSLAHTLAENARQNTGGDPIAIKERWRLGAILHELLKNTHQWAKTDELGVPLLRSVRGLLTQGHNFEKKTAMKAAADAPPLADYLSTPKFLASDGRLRFLELSVFDSGPGLAKRWISTYPATAVDPANPTLAEECSACSECFRRWKSSSGAGHKGAGLFEVMRMLSRLSGFFRVRTGRLSLYRNFVERPFDGSIGDDGSLNDWTTRSIASSTALAPAEGTLYTILIPM